MTRPSPATSSAPGTLRLSLVLSLLMAFGPFSIDMYLPALPAIGASLQAGQDQVQLSLALFLAGFAVGQLAWGPVGDRFGRKLPIFLGIAVFILASLGCATTQNVYALAGFRFLQAVGGAAAPVLARAMVRDLFTKDEAARMLSLLMLVMSLAPLVAPLAGGAVFEAWGWRAIFWILVGVGCVAALALSLLPETLPPERREEVPVGAMLAGYGGLLASRSYLGYALSGALLYGAMFAYISGTPFVYIDYFGVPPRWYGLLFGLNTLGMMTANMANRVMVRRFGADHMLRLGLAGAALAGLLLAVSGSWGALGLFGIVAPLFLFMATLGIINPNAMAGAMSAFPRAAGAASALAGTLQFTFGALAGVAVGLLADGTPRPMVWVMATMGVMGFGLHRLLTRSTTTGI